MKKTELLIPAGDLARCKVAIDFGADAVYIGGQNYSLRYRASNFSLSDIAEAVDYAHQHQCKIYVTVNMIFHDEDLPGIEKYLLDLDEIGVDAIIVASPWLVELKAQLKLRYQIHVSTQLSLLNSEDIAFYQELGADRVVLARELGLVDIKVLKEKTSFPIEVFIHGAMCSNYSGRCTLSNDLTGRDANRGGCAQSCRWKYYLYQNEQLISRNDKLFSFSSKDLSGLDYAVELMKAGIDSFKIEGRMKSAYYIAILTRTYREFIDDYYENAIISEEKMAYYRQELKKAENRPTGSGFFAGLPDKTGHLYDENGAGVTHDYVGDVLSYDELRHLAEVRLRNVIKIDDVLEVISWRYPGQAKRFIVEVIYDSEKQLRDLGNQPMTTIYLPVEFRVYPGDFIRKAEENDF